MLTGAAVLIADDMRAMFAGATSARQHHSLVVLAEHIADALSADQAFKRQTFYAAAGLADGQVSRPCAEN